MPQTRGPFSGYERIATAMRPIAVLLLLAIPARTTEPPYPVLVTAKTQRDKKVLAALEKPGRVVFSDGFESPKSFEKYFEIGGRKDGRVVLETDARLAHSGRGAIRLTARARDGKESGASAVGWLGPKGHDQLYLHYRGFRWRNTERLTIKRFTIDIYVHKAQRDNVVWHDDVVLSTRYIGPLKQRASR